MHHIWCDWVVNLKTIASCRSNRFPLLIMLTEPMFSCNTSVNISTDNRYYNRFSLGRPIFTVNHNGASVFTSPITLGIAHARPLWESVGICAAVLPTFAASGRSFCPPKFDHIYHFFRSKSIVLFRPCWVPFWTGAPLLILTRSAQLLEHSACSRKYGGGGGVGVWGCGVCVGWGCWVLLSSNSFTIWCCILISRPTRAFLRVLLSQLIYWIR